MREMVEQAALATERVCTAATELIAIVRRGRAERMNGSTHHAQHVGESRRVLSAGREKSS